MLQKPYYCNLGKGAHILDKFTQLIKTEIKRQYKSVRQFSEKSDIPYSTLSNALSKGIGGTSFETVLKICSLLGLKHMYNIHSDEFDEKMYDMLAMLSALDERGMHTIKTVLRVEYDRCTSKASKKRNNG
jgi:DNA-binding phage protein